MWNLKEFWCTPKTPKYRQNTSSSSSRNFLEIFLRKLEEQVAENIPKLPQFK